MNTIGLARRALLRTGKLVPIARLLVVGELAVELRRHVAKLEPAERARLLALLRQARGGRHALTQNERSELLGLVARMEPQAFIGMAVKRASPIPVPRRLVEGGANESQRDPSPSILRSNADVPNPSERHGPAREDI